MCGLVGVLGKITPQAFNAFEAMLTADITRGKDSTGVALVTKDNKIHCVKEPILPLNLIRHDDYAEYIESQVSQAVLLMGHNRAATKGEVTKRNAHPFRYGSIIGCHNGTLSSNLKPDDKEFDVDSKSIFHSINKKGIEWTWENLEGAATLTYWDAKQKRFNLLSNGKRSFFFIESEDKEQVFYASEEWMIYQALEQSGIKWADQMWKLKDHILIQYGFDDGKVVEYDGVELQAHKPASYTHTYPTVQRTWKGGGTGVNQPVDNDTDDGYSMMYYGTGWDFCIFCEDRIVGPVIGLDTWTASCQSCASMENIRKLRDEQSRSYKTNLTA